MLKKMLSYFTLLLLLLLGNSSGDAAPKSPGIGLEGRTGTLEKMIATNGNVVMDLDLGRLRGIRSEKQESKRDTFHFEVDPNSFFTIRVFNDVLRGPEPGSMGLILGNSAVLPEPLKASSNQLVLEKMRSGGRFDLAVRDGKTGFVFFNIEGDLYEYDAAARLLSMKGGRLLISDGLANKLGRPAEAGVTVGEISIATTMNPIGITTFVNGAAKSTALPPRSVRPPNAPEGGRAAGPDIIVGDLPAMVQAGSNGSQVGLGIATTSCNNGDQEVDFFALPLTDHSVVSQNLYRMSGGPDNNDRFEQIGQAWVKHTFGADQDDDCGLGCSPAVGFTTLGVGCSDPYDAGENAIYTLLGSRAWVNPFTGDFPSTASNHQGHAHNGTTHRLLVEASDLNNAMNPGATYYAEVQYDTPQEYAWCQAHAGQCNMYNNASYSRYEVTGTTSFTFASVGFTVQKTPATNAWTGATSATIEPEPGVDGRAFIVYKVTNPSAGVWHYEYAIHNQNLDRSIQSFTVPLGCGITLSNIGFHAPPNHPGIAFDGTQGNAGFSNAAWTSNPTADAVSWSSEPFGQNQNANAIRFATMYNFRFDSDRPPHATNATIGFFKTGAPITVGIQGPIPCNVTPTPSPTPLPPGTAQAVNLSTRMRVQTGDNVGIGGFIVTGTVPKHVLLRAIGPSLTQSGVPNVLADPVMELRGSGAFVTITNDNWRDDPVQQAAIIATGIPPTNDLESAIDVTLNPGAYTAIVRDKNNTPGVGLVEMYDLNQDVAGKLANISTRAFVGTVSDIVIAGLTLGSHRDNDRIVVRGIGPSLAAVGVANALANPTLELRDLNGALLASNNDWQENAAQAAELTAAGLAPTNNLESGIAATLPAGAYTALLSGVTSSVGAGLVEVYDLGAP